MNSLRVGHFIYVACFVLLSHLPSVLSHEGTKLIDLTDEVSIVNKKTMATAKTKREFTDTSANKVDMDR